jgi:crossover junction endodeoxyribonuclease RusA
MLPFEFVVDGPPLSQQTRNRARLQLWKQRVRAAAEARIPGGQAPVRLAVSIKVTYYHDGPVHRMDNDNYVKPIQDALNGLVYFDDRQVTDTSIRKTDINGAFRIRRASLVLLEAFHRGEEFIHVIIEEAPDHREILR